MSKVVYTSPASARLQPAGRSSATLSSGFNHDNKQYVAPLTQRQRAQHRPSPSRADGSGCCILPVPGPRQPASDPTGCSRCRPSASLCRGTVRVGSSSHFLPPPQPTLSRAAQCSGGTDAMTQNCGCDARRRGAQQLSCRVGFHWESSSTGRGPRRRKLRKLRHWQRNIQGSRRRDLEQARAVAKSSPARAVVAAAAAAASSAVPQVEAAAAAAAAAITLCLPISTSASAVSAVLAAPTG